MTIKISQIKHYDSITGYEKTPSKQDGLMFSSALQAAEEEAKKSAYVNNPSNSISPGQNIDSPHLTLSRPSLNKSRNPDLINNDSNIITEDNLLILDMYCPEIGLQTTVFGYANESKTLLPLRAITESLDFNIQSSAETGSAKGWFIDENNNFDLNTRQGTVTIGNEKFSFNPDLIKIADDELYIESGLLTQWFPVNFDISKNNLTLKIEPRETLPAQLHYQREQSWNKLTGGSDDTLHYPLLKDEYSLFSFPLLDVSSFNSWRPNSENSKYKTSYSILAEGELARLGTSLYAHGNEDDQLEYIRVRFERVNTEGKLLGPLQAKSVAAGDINPTTVPIIPSGGKELGVRISNQDLLRSSDFNSVLLEGNAQPGWDVELYRNGILHDAQKIDQSGKYSFKDAPVFFGKNDFIVKAFGPQGQQHILEEKSFTIGSDMSKKGKSEYNISLSRKQKGLIELDSQENRDQGVRLNSSYLQGITDNLSAHLAASSNYFDQNRHNYLYAGIAGSYSSFYGKTGLIVDTEGGAGLRFEGQMPWGKINTKARFDKFFDLATESEPQGKQDSNLYLGINGTIPQSIYLPELHYTFSNNYSIEDNQEKGTLSSSIAANFNQLSIVNNSDFNYLNKDTNTPFLKGNFKISGNLGRNRVTGGIDYNTEKDNEITQYFLSGNIPLTYNLDLEGSIAHSIDDDHDITTLSAGLNIDNKYVSISPRINYNSDGEFTGLLNISFSLGHNPLNNSLSIQASRKRGTGSIAARVYHDKNNNGIFDKTDEPLPDVEIIAPQGRKQADTDKNGVALLSNLRKYKPTDVTINTETLEDPFWTPAVKGVAVTPKAGSMHTVEFPVITTGEVDGTVYLQDSQGVTKPLTNQTLELLDGNNTIVQKTKTEYDGFYLFEKVPPGQYHLQVAPNQDNTAANKLQPITIEIGNDGTISSGNDFILKNSTPVSAATRTIPEDTQETGKQNFQNSIRINSLKIETDLPVRSPQNISSGNNLSLKDDTPLSVTTDTIGKNIQQTSKQEFQHSIRINPLKIDTELPAKPPQNTSAEKTNTASTALQKTLDTPSPSTALYTNKERQFSKTEQIQKTDFTQPVSTTRNEQRSQVKQQEQNPKIKEQLQTQEDALFDKAFSHNDDTQLFQPIGNPIGTIIQPIGFQNPLQHTSRPINRRESTFPGQAPTTNRATAALRYASIQKTPPAV